jgi:hypothetical protein
MPDVVGPALVEGHAKTEVLFTESVTRTTIKVIPDKSGVFKATVPQGEYTVHADGMDHNMTLLPGAIYKFDPGLDFVVTASTDTNGHVMIELTVNGNGKHEFSIRTDNLTLNENNKYITVTKGMKKKLVWQGKVNNVTSPWFAVVVPDNDPIRRKEINGAVMLTK